VSTCDLRYLASGMRLEQPTSPISRRCSNASMWSVASPCRVLSRVSSPTKHGFLSDARDQLLSPSKSASPPKRTRSQVLVDHSALFPVREAHETVATPGQPARSSSTEHRCLELQLEQCEEAVRHERAKSAAVEEWKAELHSKEQLLANKQHHMSQQLLDLEVERERFEVEKGELNDFRKKFLLSNIHSADEEIMKREQAMREEQRMVAEERSQLAEQRLLLEDARRELKEREETLVEQMIQSGMLAQDRLLASPAAHLATTRTSGHQMRRRFGRWCIGLLVVAFAVSSMRVWGSTPLWPVVCRGAWDRIRCLRAPTLTAWEPLKFANPLQIQMSK